MKRLNLKNQVSDDDETLVSLLKTSIGQVPSEQFVENTLEKFLILKTKQRKVHKPLKTPLYIMMVIGLILLTPAFFSFNSKISFPDHRFGLVNIFEYMSSALDPRYALSLMLLLLVSMLVMWIELGLVKFRNPFF